MTIQDGGAGRVSGTTIINPNMVSPLIGCLRWWGSPYFLTKFEIRGQI